MRKWLNSNFNFTTHRHTKNDSFNLLIISKILRKDFEKKSEEVTQMIIDLI